MERDVNFEKLNKDFHDAIERMKLFTKPSITQVVGNFDDQTGELIGSGTFISYKDALYLVTAYHVAAKLFSQNIDGSRKYASGLSHSIGNAQRYAAVVQTWTTWGPPEDLAIVRVDPELIQGTDIVPLQYSHFAETTEGLGKDIYFVHGWPGKQSHFTAFFERGIIATSLPYGGVLTSSSWSGFNEATHFAITYPADGVTKDGGEPVTLPDPGGLSGAAVWKTNRIGSGDQWTPEMSTVVGVATRYDQDQQCIVVTRAEYVKGLIRYVDGS